jgi:hypothetical protein
LYAGQCRSGCGLRATNERLAMKVALPKPRMRTSAKMRDAPMRARREKRPSVRKTETQASPEQRSAKPKRDANDAATKEKCSAA